MFVYVCMLSRNLTLTCMCVKGGGVYVLVRACLKGSLSLQAYLFNISIVCLRIQSQRSLIT